MTLDRLPRLTTRTRTRLLAGLVGTGSGQALLAALTAVTMPLLLDPGSTPRRWAAAGALATGAVALGLLRKVERVQAERLGQHYVQEVRSGLVASSLVDRGPALGVTVTRASNDLNSVRNWIALGIAPLCVAAPVLLGTTLVLWFLEPLLALAVVVPVMLLGVALVALARPTYSRSRELRRRRGHLASHLADTVTAADTIRAAGGVDREVRRIKGRGDAVVEAAVRRAEVAGWLRGVAAATAALSLVAVAVLGVVAGVGATTIATALTVVGVVGGPIGDLGRVVEYRQSFRAARRILGPALVAGRLTASTSRSRFKPDEGPIGSLLVLGLVVDEVRVPDLEVNPGDRVLLRGPAERVEAVIGVLAGTRAPDAGRIQVAGVDLLTAGSRDRRALVGVALHHASLERGTIARAIRYRAPGAGHPAGVALAEVGLADRVAALPDGERTTLRRGGEPLTSPEQGRLLLARATYDDPPLVVLSRLESQLGLGGQDALASVVARCHGVIVAAADDPSYLEAATTWEV